MFVNSVNYSNYCKFYDVPIGAYGVPMKSLRIQLCIACLLVCSALVLPIFSYSLQASRSLEIQLTPGPYYTGRGGWFIFGYDVEPQVAIWLETADGKYLETLFVTRRGAEKAWRAAPKSGRPEALPVWNHLHETEVDDVSAATSQSGVQKAVRISDNLAPGTYRVVLETNRSYDYNDVFPKKLGVNGQPSVIYRADITIGQGPVDMEFQPVGQGDPAGLDGQITEGLEGLDTALQLFSDLRVIYEEH